MLNRNINWNEKIIFNYFKFKRCIIYRKKKSKITYELNIFTQKRLEK